MNIFNHNRPFFSRLRSVAYFDPVRDWLVMLILSVFAFISIVVWNIWAFDTVAQGGILGATTSETKQSFNLSSIGDVNEILEKRANEEAKYRIGVYRYADPSQ